MGKEFAVNRKMNRKRMVLLTVTLCLVARTARGDEVVRAIDWQALASANARASGTAVSAPDGVNGPSLRVDHRGTGSETFGLLTLDHPKISSARYALKGRVRYEDVEEAIAYLGIGTVALGGLALLSGQPYAVYYPLLPARDDQRGPRPGTAAFDE